MSYRGRGGGVYRGGGGISSGGGGGTYRGRGGDTWRGGGNRGNYSGSSGRVYSSDSSYDSRTRSYFQDEERYKMHPDTRSYRQDEMDYSARGYDLRGPSPDTTRKRFRPDPSPYSMGPTRRSHERSFGSGGNDYSSRSFYMSDRGSGGGYLEDKPSFRDMSRQVSRSSDYSFRKPTLAPRAPRGSFPRGRSFSRGRGRSRGRGLSRSGISSGFISRRKPDIVLLRRKRNVAAKYRDELRLKLLKQRSKRLKEDKDSEGSKSEEENQEEEEEVEEEEIVEEVEEEEEEDEGVVAEGENEGDRKQDVNEELNQDAESDKHPEDGEEDSGKKKKEIVAEGEEAESKKKPIKKKIIKKIVKKVIKKKNAKATKASQPKKEDDKAEDDEKGELKDYLGQPFIRLKCPHCGYTGVTFQDYSYHLRSRKHQTAMKFVFLQLRQTLARMRVDQRRRQTLLDEQSQSVGGLKTIFCSICKLNYRTYKAEHMATRSHKKMMEFLFPFCRTCLISFKTPMLYESHICELAHIKHKARIERLKEAKKDEKSDSDSDLDTNNFMVLDSVGSGDESEDAKSEGKEEDKENKQEVEKKKKKSEPKSGAEFCRVVEANFCELCRIFLPITEDKSKALSLHCRTRLHLQRWMREMNKRKHKSPKSKRSVKDTKKDDQILSKEENAKEEKSAVDDEKTNDVDVKEAVPETKEDDKPTESVKEESNKGLNEVEDKMWTEVDKDLSDLLNEEENKYSDDEDSGERYDRFNDDQSSEGQKKKSTIESSKEEENQVLQDTDEENSIEETEKNEAV